MEVKIEVNEEQFKDLLEKELTDLPKETIQNILIESIKEYLKEDDYKNLNAFLVNKECNHYSNYSIQPSQFFYSMLENCDYSSLQEVADNMIKDLKENYQQILIQVLSNQLANGIANNDVFRANLRDVIDQELYKRNQG